MFSWWNHPTHDARDFATSFLPALLHERMDISPAEASSQGVWAFVACVMLPDVVRWRFPGGEATTLERFLGGPHRSAHSTGRRAPHASFEPHPGGA